MSERLRTLDSRISFFAFADIITAVSGMLIFITLLLATDLGRPTNNHASDAERQTEDQLDDVLRQQLETDAQTRQLQEVLGDAETAPAVEKLEADIVRLETQLSAEQKSHSSVIEQMTKNAAALQARDATLGLTDLKATIHRTIQEADLTANQEAKVREKMDNLELKVSAAQSRLFKLREMEGQLWLVPDKNNTTKEPILVTVAGKSITVEAFDHPEQRKQWDNAASQSSFSTYLGKASSLNQYIVFLVRPSGIQLFKSLVESARAAGFEVGFDALEEDRPVHYSTPPPMDDPATPENRPATEPVTPASASDGKPDPAATTTPTKPGAPASVPPVAPPSQNQSWWQRLLRRMGLTIR
jgi:hypothetical protein